jgi:hypothetical protein
MMDWGWGLIADSDNIPSKLVDIFDGSSGRWSTAVLSVARSGLAATSLPNQGLAIFAGGYEAGGNTADLFAWCPPGCYVAGNDTRLPCPAGRYTHQYGATACQACDAGSFNPGGQPALSCKPCDAGSYSGPAQAACTLCDAGSYYPSTGSSACTLCDAGTYNPVIGSTFKLACKNCDPGSLCTQKGLSRQLQCPPGSYCPTPLQVFLCPAGTYSPEPGFFPPNALSCELFPTRPMQVKRLNLHAVRARRRRPALKAPPIPPQPSQPRPPPPIRS